MFFDILLIFFRHFIHFRLFSNHFQISHSYFSDILPTNVTVSCLLLVFFSSVEQKLYVRHDLFTKSVLSPQPSAKLFDDIKTFDLFS